MSMLCQRCNKNKATFHLADVEDRQIRNEIHLCVQCVQSKGIQYKVHLSFADLLQGLMEKKAGAQMMRLAELQCPSCGITFAEFRRKARLGCPKDYEVFEEGLKPLLERVHGSVEHKGKRPQALPSSRLAEKELDGLRADLEASVRKERFEEAAALRDKIRKLEEETRGPEASAAPKPRSGRRAL